MPIVGPDMPLTRFDVSFSCARSETHVHRVSPGVDTNDLDPGQRFLMLVNKNVAGRYGRCSLPVIDVPIRDREPFNPLMTPFCLRQLATGLRRCGGVCKLDEAILRL